MVSTKDDMDKFQCPLYATDKQNPLRRWHVGKEIPIATIAILLTQTVGIVWLAASTVAKVDYIKESNIANQIIQTAIDKKQDEEFRRSEDRVVAEIRELKLQLSRIIEIKTK